MSRSEEVFPDIYRIQVPLPRNPLRAVNSYLIRGPDRCLMVDTGMNRPECIEVMRASLTELAVDVERTDFFITHGHADHVGLVSELTNGSSQVYLHTADACIVSGANLWTDMAAAARTYGFPDPDAAVAKHPGRKYLFTGQPRFADIREGDTLSVGRYTFRCVETPGHTPGHTCLYEPSARIFFSGDHVLDSITPNITGWGAESDPLRDFLTSLEKVAAYDIRVILPGHRNPISDHRRRIQELKEHHTVRTQEVARILLHEGQTAYQVASQMTWDISYEHWKDFPIPQQWFATGEALAHLLYLEREGKVSRRWQDGVVSFCV
jgi:glyoxylase-like metal-dependent hydrolase (beta-lactamase superfamily II)